jgi:DNA polymerase-3 subunit alpha
MMTPNNFTSQFSKLSLPLHGVRLPSFTIENEHKRQAGVSEDVDNYDFLRALALTGLRELGVKKNSKLHKKYVERAQHELDTLKELGFIDYVLLVWDVINYCKQEKIPTGQGRGSAAGSLILFLIGVTGIDPIRYGLYFERFVSKIRAKKKVVDGVTYLDGTLMCDVDIDVCYYRRQEVLKYLEQKFAGKTSKILTLNTLSGKLLIKECGKIAASKNETEMNIVSAMIPKVYGQVKDLEEAYEEVPSFQDWCEENRETYDIALKLRYLIKNKGVHASGMLLSHEELENCCPTELDSSKNPVSSFDMNWVSLFNVKLDLLGLRSVSVVHDVCKNIGIEIDDLDVNDPFIYRQLQNLECPHGLFQIEADTNYKVCKQVKPKNLEELSAVLALARPGALAFADQYANYTNNDTYEAIHPFFDDILSSTGGVALYQEQLMQMANKVGFTLDEAEILRRIVGKKKVSEVRKWKKKIREKIKENNLDKEVSDILWKVLEDSANYSFNKSHSIAYAALAAITIYLKFKHPQQFFLSLLKMTRHEPDPILEISKIHQELDRFGMELLQPHIIKSDLDFSMEGKDIRFGLLSIKGISEKSIERINNFRNKYSNKFEIFEASEEAGLTIGMLSALIQAGALDGFSQSRSKIVLEAQLWNLLTKREKRFCVPLAEKFDYDLVKILKYLKKFKDEKNKVVIKESRFETIKRKYEPYKQIYLLNNRSETFANWYYEKHLLGYTYGTQLKDIFVEKFPDLTSVRELSTKPLDSEVQLMANVIDTYSGVSKNKNKYIRFELSDETGLYKAMIVNNRRDTTKVEDFVEANEGMPEKGSILYVKGTKKEDIIFANVVRNQSCHVYTKLSQLKSIR